MLQALTTKNIQSAARDLARRPASNLPFGKVLHLARRVGKDIYLTDPFLIRQRGYFYVRTISMRRLLRR